MAEITTKECDRCKRLRATRHRIEVSLVSGDDQPIGEPARWFVDLCAMDYDQLLDKIAKGIKPPVKREREGGGDGK